MIMMMAGCPTPAIYRVSSAANPRPLAVMAISMVMFSHHGVAEFAELLQEKDDAEDAKGGR